MDGKRFGIGLAAGILLGLAVITASGGLASSSRIWGGPQGPNQNLAALTTSTTAAGAASANSTVTQSTTTGTGPALAFGASSTSTTKTQVGSTNTSPPSQKSVADLSSGANNPGYSSHIASIAQQPLLTNAVVFVPVLVAILLGAIIYRASRSGGEKAPEADS